MRFVGCWLGRNISATIDFLRNRRSSFFHFTDLRNLESIAARGLLSLREIEELGLDYVPGGNDWSHDADRYKGVDRYVHLSFDKSHPMEFVARQEGRIITSRLLRIKPEVLAIDGAMITHGVANAADVAIEPAEEALTKLDFAVLYTRTDWRDPEIKERLKKARKCELLIPNLIAPEFIENL